jgi:hypothetical protein
MTLATLLPRFENLAITRNPVLARKLLPGLSEASIRRELRRWRIDGDLANVVTLYRWRNGTRLDQELAASKKGMFPAKAPFYLLDLEMACGHLDHARVVARSRLEMAGADHFFPLFWQGDVTWLAIDLTPGSQSRVILADHRARAPFRELWATLEIFLTAAIAGLEANEEVRLTTAPAD